MIFLNSRTSRGQNSSPGSPASSSGARIGIRNSFAWSPLTIVTGRFSYWSPVPVQPADEVGDRLQRPHRGGKGDALELAAERHQPLDRGDEVGAPLAAGHRVDLVEDHGRDAGQDVPAALGGEQDVEALGGGDEDLGGVAQHPAPLAPRACRRSWSGR